MIRMSRESGSSASASTNALGPANGSEIDALERALEHRAVGDLQQAGVEALVEIDVRARTSRSRRLWTSSPISSLIRRQRADRGATRSALGGEAGGRALEHAAQLDRVADVRLRELAHDVAAALEAAQQPLVLELGEREPQRRPRDAEPLDQRQLRHPLAGRELAVEDQLAQAQERPHDLGSVGCVRASRRADSSPPGGLHARVACRRPLQTFFGALLTDSCMQALVVTSISHRLA